MSGGAIDPRLVAAAPDLYDGCKMARQALAWARSRLPPSAQADVDGEPINLGRHCRILEVFLDTVIAKAEGRQS